MTVAPAPPPRPDAVAIVRRPAFEPFRTPVRGHRFAARPPGVEPPVAGQRAGLHREHGHPVDPWAIAVWIRDASGIPWRIGYLDRTVAARLAPRLDAGLELEARIDGWWAEPAGRWKRPVVRIGPVAQAATVDGRPAGPPSGTVARERGPSRSLWGTPARSLRRVVGRATA